MIDLEDVTKLTETDHMFSLEKVFSKCIGNLQEKPIHA